MTFRVSLILGWLYTHGRSDSIPTFERYFLGGAYSLRGYALESIAPTRKIPLQSEVAFSTGRLFWGGSKKLLFNAEFEFQISKEM